MSDPLLFFLSLLILSLIINLKEFLNKIHVFRIFFDKIKYEMMSDDNRLIIFFSVLTIVLILVLFN